MHLNYCWAAGHGVMVHVGVKVGGAAGSEGHHLAVVPTVTHANFEVSGDYGYVLTLGMPVRWDFVAVGHLQANREVSTGRGGVAFQHGKLCAWRDKWRDWAKLNLIRAKCILCRGRRQRSQDAGTQQNDKKHWFHRSEERRVGKECN